MRHWQLFFISAIITSYNSITIAQTPGTAGIGGISTVTQNLWAIHNNQAGLTKVNKSTFGVSIKNNFLIEELTDYNLAAALPTKSGTFGIGASLFGYKLYHRNRYSIAFGKQLTPKISSGIQLSYFSTRSTNEITNRWTIAPEGGIQIKLSDKLIIGTHFFNPFYRKNNKSNKVNIPSILKIGFSYTFSDKVISFSEIEKSTQELHKIKMGLIYKPAESIQITTGVCTNPILVTFGVRINHNNLHFDFAFTQHQILGTSPQLSAYHEF